MSKFRCFTRTWWRENPKWPNGLEPCAGEVRYKRNATFETEAEAQEYCREWNATHDPGRLSLKCEYEEI